jgi:predicted transcriptional regulator
MKVIFLNLLSVIEILLTIVDTLFYSLIQLIRILQFKINDESSFVKAEKRDLRYKWVDLSNLFEDMWW